MKLSRRIEDLPQYLFAEIDQVVTEKKRQGYDIIDFGVGDPDLPTPPHIVDRLCLEAAKPENQRYPSYRGMVLFREAAASWVLERFGVSLDPEKEVLALIGAKEGIANFPVVFVDQGDLALIPDPSYPVYRTATLLCDGIPELVPLLEENEFLPVLGSIPEEAWRKAKLFFLNYPNNPTSAVADMQFFEELVFYARKYDVILAHDNAYSEITFDGFVAPSLLQVPGAREIAVEFHSLSKTYNMTGWRIGFAIGGDMIIDAFGRVKTNIDSGVFNAIQYAGIAALEGYEDCIQNIREVYSHRRDVLVEGLRDIGWNTPLTRATPYIWMRIPDGYSSRDFARDLLEKAEVVVAPGSAYGPSGEGYVRFSLTLPDHRLIEGLQRMKSAFS